MEKTNIENCYFNSKNTLYITSGFLFDFDKTLEENIYYIYKYIFNQKISCATILDVMKIDEELSKSILKISTGTLKKVHVSPIMMLEYDYYFLDEIFTNLDGTIVDILINRIIELINDGKTVIMSEHRQDIIDSLEEQVGDKVWKINL